MTRIAILADIHGNVPAMEAVLADLERLSPDEILVGGDLVGRGPEGSHVATTIRERGWRGVRGNHEEYLLAFRKHAVPDGWDALEEWAASRWMADELTDRDVRYIEALPFSLHSALEPELCLVHGSPRSVNEGIGPWTSDGQIDRHLERIEGRVLVCGHTHRPGCWRREGGLVVNAGAVGLPFNRDRRAQYAVLTRDSRGWQVEARQVEYDLERILSIYDTSGFLEHGAVTARLLRMELEYAAPFLVPFIQWATVQARPVVSSQLPAFLEIYDPDEPTRSFLDRIRPAG